jgi:predicted RecA/RadA family phage recombinase
MSNTLNKRGYDPINFTAPAARTIGDVEEFADCIGVWMDSVASGAVGPVDLFNDHILAKETGVAFAVGDILYWDATNNRLDKTNTNIPAGVCVTAAASGDTSAEVRLNPGIGA